MLKLLFALLFGLGVAKADHAYNVVILGDSVTMGVWADTRLGAPNGRFYWQALRAEVQATLQAFVHGVKVNDLSNARKYSKLIDKYFGFIARRKISGMLGDADYSLKPQLEARLSRPVVITEASVLAGSYILSTELLAKIDEYRREGTFSNADLVIIDFHGMDVVFAGSVDDFSQHVRVTLRGIADRFPDATVVVTPVLDVLSMVLSVHDLVTVPGGFMRAPMRCRDAYSKIGFSQSLGLFEYAPNIYAADDLTKKRQRYNAMQDILRDEVYALDGQDLMSGYDKFKGRAIYAIRREIGPSEWAGILAVDCIHPNIDGQKLLVEDLLSSLDGVVF